MVTIALVDPQCLFREALRVFLEAEGDFAVVGEGSTGVDAIEITEKIHPEILLLELLLPKVHGLEVLRKIRDCNGTRPVIVSSHSNASYVIEAFKSGAAGYILKENHGKELTQAIRAAAAGDHYISKELKNCALEVTIGRYAPGKRNGEDRLTNRERVVLELTAEGVSNAEIANRLTISRRTVESHRASILQKLGIKTQTELVRYAIRHNIIAP